MPENLEELLLDWNPDLNDFDDERYPGELDPPTAAELEEAATKAKQPMGALWRTYKSQAKLASRSGEEIVQSMKAIIKYMWEEHDMDPANFLDQLCWKRTETTRDPTLQSARTAVMHCDMLPQILRRCRRPPRKHNKGVSTVGAWPVIADISCETVDMVVNAEMRALAPIFRSPKELTEEYFMSIKLGELVETIKRTAPVLWARLEKACSTPRQYSNTYKDHDARILQMIATMCYSRSQHRSMVQMLNSIVLKAGGIAAKSNDTLHLFGITMSQKWGYSGFDRLGEARRAAMKVDVQKLGLAFYTSYDNLGFKFRSLEQRLSNQQASYDNGTAGTLYVIQDKTVQMPDLDTYITQRAIGASNPIEAIDIFDADDAVADRLREQSIHILLRFLVDSPAFNRHTYEGKDDPALSPPEPVTQLPTGPEFALCQYMLDTLHIEQASQEGNRKCIEEFQRQTILSGEQGKQEEALKKLVLSRKVWVWIGDQLTIERIRSIKKDRSQDLNFLQRFDHVLAVFGWFHLQIAQEASYHRQFFTTSLSLGLKHSADLLKRRGLATAGVQGHFHNHMQELLLHVAEARFRDIWRLVGGVQDLSELRKKSPKDLLALATKIHDEFASTLALETLDAKPQNDYVLRNSILFCRDILDYVDLHDAMKSGDVGRMRNLLPRLLYRFQGGGNHKYAIEVLELMQGLLREWPDELISFVMQYCWLVNTTGAPNCFGPIDLCQEHNIRDIKYLFVRHGPYVTWEWLASMSATIPALRKIKDHVEQEFNHFARGKSHTSPEKEQDIVALQESYRIAKAHEYRAGRPLDPKHRFKDFNALGSNPQRLCGFIKRWQDGRCSEWSTTDIWAEESESAEVSENYREDWMDVDGAPDLQDVEEPAELEMELPALDDNDEFSAVYNDEFDDMYL